MNLSTLENPANPSGTDAFADARGSLAMPTSKREKHKQKPCEADNIDALHRDGQARSSVEAAVMAVERRGLVTQLQSFGQLPRRRSR